jgi:hypothetical protein
MEGLQKDLENLRALHDETDHTTGIHDIREKEEELEQAEKELKKLIEPVSDLLV